MGGEVKGGRRGSFLSSPRLKRTSICALALLGGVAYAIFFLAAAADRSSAMQFVDPTLVNDGNPPPDDCSPLDPQVIVYNRIPKAGSSTLITLLRKMSQANGFRILVPRPKHDPVAARSAIVHALQDGNRTVVVEHFHFPDIIDPRLAYINVMRNPVDRCISAFYYLRYGPRDEASRAKALQRYGNMTLDECMKRPFGELEQCFNCPSQGQARFFCGPEWGVCDRPTAEEMLRRSWFNMETQYFVGLTEDLVSTVDVLESVYPTFFKGMGKVLAETEPERVNEHAYDAPSEKTTRKIATWTAVDSELYSRAGEKLKRLHGECMKRREGGSLSTSTTSEETEEE